MTEELETSKTERLGRAMAGLGFSPKDAKAKDCLEYTKLYNDSKGKIAKVVAVIKKDSVGLEPELVDFFVVTVQTQITAIEETIVAKAPNFAKADMLAVAAFFDEQTNEVLPVNMTSCDLCGEKTPNFIAFKNEEICEKCARRKGLL